MQTLYYYKQIYHNQHQRKIFTDAYSPQIKFMSSCQPSIKNGTSAYSKDEQIKTMRKILINSFFKAKPKLIQKIFEFYNILKVRMRTVKLNLQFQKIDQQYEGIDEAQHLISRKIHPQVVPIYEILAPREFILCMQIVNKQQQFFGIMNRWGKPLSQYTNSHFQSFFAQQHLISFLTIIVELKPHNLLINLNNLYFEMKQQPKLFLTQICSSQQYFQNAIKLISSVFAHIKPIIQKNSSIKNMKDYELWLRDLKPMGQAKSISQILQIKLEPKKDNNIRVNLTEEEKKWILAQTNHSQTQQMQLVYNGLASLFNPTPLLKAANKRSLLFLIETTEARRAAFWMAVKPQINTQSLFGQYYCDKTRKSVLLGIDKRSIHTLADQNFSVGFGNEVLIAVGKTDVVLSAFNISNVSYFPCSYNRDEEKRISKSQDLLGREFTLKQFEAYTLN